MNKFFKKAVSFVLAIAVISSIGCVAFANAEMEHMVFVGYDTTNPYSPNRIYNEVIDGVQTGKQILEPVAPTWQVEGYEAVYPYAGYSRMYLDGKAQKITGYNNLFPQWEERRQDYMWQLKAPYYIYERQQTKVNNENWTWDFGNKAFGIPDAALLTKTSKKAVVLDQGYKYYGFGAYSASGKPLTYDEIYMYQNFLVPNGIGGTKTLYNAAIDQWNWIVANELTVEKLSERESVFGTYVVSDADIAAMIPVVSSKYITAKFNNVNDDGLATKVVADEYLLHSKDYGWEWDTNDSFAITADANIEWTEPKFEEKAPHKMYQYLIINHIVMDGTNGKAKILRYTDGEAMPKVEWRFVFYQHLLDANGKEIPDRYEAVEQKYIDGVAVLDNDGNYIYRVPTLGFNENAYFVMDGDSIEVWKVDIEGVNSRLAKVDNWIGSLGGFIDAYANGSFRYVDVVPAEVNKMLP